MTPFHLKIGLIYFKGQSVMTGQHHSSVYAAFVYAFVCCSSSHRQKGAVRAQTVYRMITLAWMYRLKETHGKYGAGDPHGSLKLT